MHTCVMVAIKGPKLYLFVYTFVIDTISTNLDLFIIKSKGQKFDFSLRSCVIHIKILKLDLSTIESKGPELKHFMQISNRDLLMKK